MMDFEKLIAQNNSDLPVALNYVESDSGKRTLTNKLNAYVLDEARAVAKEIATKLNAFKDIIGDGSDLDRIGRARLKSLEKTADAFANRILSQVKGITLPLELTINTRSHIG